MEKHIDSFVNKLSYTSITIATLTLLLFYLPNTNLKTHQTFPKSTCDLNFTHRSFTTITKHNHRIWSTKAWIQTVNSFKAQFQYLQAKHNLFSINSQVLIVSAGPGQAVMALNRMGMSNVTGVEVVDSPPLVSRADLHKLPFVDNVFEFGFGLFFERALLPARYAMELERAVRSGGACVVAVEACGVDEVEEILKLFRKSKLLGVQNVTVGGEERTNIVMRVVK